jgi:glutamate/tyrosine decarboxylase-like PLP-dependent enzyme
MHPHLQHDHAHLDSLLERTLHAAQEFLRGLPQRPVIAHWSPPAPRVLPKDGLGADGALRVFLEQHAAGLTGSTGPRYWGFVTGGSTPAALMGDWLVGAFDQNPTSKAEAAALHLERDALTLLRQLFGLSDAHAGVFVSGATMANFVGLALARQWAARKHGADAAQDGLHALPPLPILSGAPHSSTYKALAMLGMGRRTLRVIATVPEREAVELGALRRALIDLEGKPSIVVANAGTVNTVDFDDLAALANLKREFGFWLHVDAAFGGFAACSPKYRALLAGLDAADSITIDAHKWLNVPYDSAMAFTRHRDLQAQVFQNSAAYLGAIGADPDPVHLTPENSRRWRALPVWLTLMAYGSDGYRDIIERDCALAQQLGERIATSPRFRLLAPVRMNVVCFTLAGEATPEAVRRFLDRLHTTGVVFMTPTVYGGAPAIRAAFCNWRTQAEDVGRAWEAMLEVISMES